MAIALLSNGVVMQASGRPRRHSAIAAIVALITVASVLNLSASLDDEGIDALIQRVVAETTREGVTLRATRHLEAGSVSGKHRGWMDVETIVNASGAFTYNVIDEGGSDRTREKVFKSLLKEEAQAARGGGHSDGALSRDNYEFVPLGVNNGLLRLELKPRRNDPKLVRGTLTVNADGHPVLLEGKLAKSPSFWVRSVTVLKRYSRFGDVSLPVSLESLADVRIVGKSTFSMRYRYSLVNGRRVGQPTMASATFGPSPRILALHARLHGGQ
jgi:hypothetical protein